MELWIPGIPATFATKGEIPWKCILEASIPKPTDEGFQGLKLDFMLPTLAPNNHPLDIDNLCEPVFSLLVNRLGWFGGKRPNIKWWYGRKVCKKPSGLNLSIEQSEPGNLKEFGKPIFDEAYQGELPRSATAPEIPHWLDSLNLPFNKGTRFAVRLQFGGLKINLGGIATGRIKSLIDCFYPILGGTKGRPEDWRIDILQVEKGVINLKENAVRITIWGIR